MTNVQRRPLPERIYEPNIIHNPLTWMGIWTPQGWRVHQKRFGCAKRVSIALSGDGKTTFFPHALINADSGQIEWQDDLHLKDDSFTDGGIYPADPRVEYPAGTNPSHNPSQARPRWAISHTLLCYPVADHNLYTHEYTWDLTHGHLQTHFRKHVLLEEARTDPIDGRSVRVRHTPISRTIEGNVEYPLPNSAVRGVWTNPQKSGDNLYTRRLVQRISMHNGVYMVAPHSPVVQCHGLWQVLPDDPIQELFDAESNCCKNPSRLIEQCGISLDEPKLGMFQPKYELLDSHVYNAQISQPTEQHAAVSVDRLKALQQRLGSKFELGRVGYGASNSFDGEAEDLASAGYQCAYDFNNNGVIDDDDAATLERHLGRNVRANLYFGAYFGGDWLSTAWCLEPNHVPGVEVIADYEYGGGYDSQTGVVRLLDTPGPNRPVWVEYHHDAPAEAGENNIIVHLYREE